MENLRFNEDTLTSMVVDLKCIEISNNWEELINNYKNDEVKEKYNIEKEKAKEYSSNEEWYNTNLQLSFNIYQKYMINRYNIIIIDYLKATL